MSTFADPDDLASAAFLIALVTYMMSTPAVLNPEVTFTHVALLIAFMTGIAVGIAVVMQFRTDNSDEIEDLLRAAAKDAANLRAAAKDAADLAKFLANLANLATSGDFDDFDDPDDSDDPDDGPD